MKTFCRSTANPQRERYVARSGCLFKAHMHEHSLKSILQSAKYSCVKSIEEANLMFTLNSLGDSDTELCGLVQKPNRSFNTLLSQHTNNLATCNNKKINNKLAEKLNFIWTELFLSHCNENVLHSLVASQKILYFFFKYWSWAIAYENDSNCFIMLFFVVVVVVMATTTVKNSSASLRLEIVTACPYFERLKTSAGTGLQLA